MHANRIGIALALVATPQVSFAYRPFDSTDAAVAEIGEIEIELGPVAYTDSRNGSITEVPVFTVNAGLANRWELVLDGSRAMTRSAGEASSETVESALLLKRVLRDGVLQERTGWSVATEFGVLFPTIHADDDVGATVALLASQEVGRTVVHVNAALAQNRDENTELFGGVIIEGNTGAPVRPVAELTYAYERGTDARSTGALIGAIWDRRDDLSFDVALRASREDHEWSYEARLGVTWSFEIAGE